jgi:hypothetical protein
MERAMREFAKNFRRECVAAAALLGLLAWAAPGLASEYEVRMPVQKTARVDPLGEASATTDKAAPEKPGKAAPEKSSSDKPAAEKAATDKAKAEKSTPAKAVEKPAKADHHAKPEKAATAEKPAEKAAEKTGDKGHAAAAKPHKPAEKTDAKPAAKPTAKHAAKPETAAADSPATGSAAPAAAPSDATKPDPQVRVKRVNEIKPAKAAKPPKPAPPEPKRDPKAALWPADAAQPEAVLPADGHWVGALRLEFREDAVVLHVPTSAQAERITWFNLAGPDGPRKLAIDLRGEWRKKGASVLRCDDGPVKAVVSGEHPDRLRLAVEFRDGAVADQLEPAVEADPHGISISIPLALKLKR